MHNAMVIIIILVYHLIGYVATMRPKGVMGTLLRSNNPMFWNTLGVLWVSVSRQVENKKKKKKLWISFWSQKWDIGRFCMTREPI